MKVLEIIKLLNESMTRNIGVKDEASSGLVNFEDLQFDTRETFFHRSLWNLGRSVAAGMADSGMGTVLPSQPARTVSTLGTSAHCLATFPDSVRLAIAEVRDRQTLLEEVCRVTVVEGGAALAWIGRSNPRTGKIEAIAKAGFPDVAARERVCIFYRDEELPFMQDALRERRHSVCNDIERDGSLGAWRAEWVRRGFRSVAIFPVTFEDGAMGWLSVCSAELGFFNFDRIASLSQLASDIAAAVQFLGSGRIAAKSALSCNDKEGRDGAIATRIDTGERVRGREENGLARGTGYYVGHLPLGIVGWDPNFGVRLWSRRAEEIFGWNAAELVGKSSTERMLFQAEEWPAFQNAMTGLLAGEPGCASVNRNYTKDGRTIYCEWHSSAIPAKHGGAASILSFVRDITDQRFPAEELSKSEQKLRALSSRIEQLREEERTRISREIHDVLGQMLTGIKLNLGWMERRLDEYAGDRDLNPLIEKLIETLELTDTTVDTMQRIASDLRPGILDKLGLPIALEHEARRFEKSGGIPCHVEIDGNSEAMPRETTTALFRIFQEALTNVARHARATMVNVVLRSTATAFILEVRDDGIGIPEFAAEEPRSLGLIGMQERARLLGGDVRLSRRPEGGTLVRAEIPGVRRNSEDNPRLPWLATPENFDRLVGESI